MDFTSWGDCHFINDNQIMVYKKSSSLEYHIVLHEKHQDIELKSNLKTILKFKDIIKAKNDLNSFTRIIKNQEYIIDDGKIILDVYLHSVLILTLAFCNYKK